MSYGYSIDLRKKALAFVEQGGRITESCRIFGISKSTLHAWIRKKKKTGSIAIEKRVKSSYKFNDEDLISYVNKKPDAYLHEIAVHFNMTAAGICVALKRLKITRKKSR